MPRWNRQQRERVRANRQRREIAGMGFREAVRREGLIDIARFRQVVAIQTPSCIYILHSRSNQLKKKVTHG